MPDPVALHIGNLTIRWYGIMVALGFLAAFQLGHWRSKKLGLPEQTAADLTFAAMVGGILGARLLYVIQNWDREFSHAWVDAFKIWEGGLVFYGGFLGALLLAVLWSLHKKLPLNDVGDMAAPALPLGHAIGRIGCFLNGCCFGRPWPHVSGVTYPGVTEDGMVNGPLYVQRRLGIVGADAVRCEPVFPIQLLSALANGLICLLLLRLADRPRWRGRLFPLYLVLYAASRFVIEFGRGDYLTRPFGLTPAQIFCLILLPLGLAWLAWNRPDPQALQQGGSERTSPSG